MLRENDSHWSEEAMRERAPLEYQQLVGRFLTQQEREEAIIVENMNVRLEQVTKKHLKKYDLSRLWTSHT